MTQGSRTTLVRVYLVEDSKFMRESLVDFMEEFLGYEVKGTAGTAEEAQEQLDGSTVDVVLVDTALPGMDGIELVGKLLKRWPALPCLMLSGHAESVYVERALEAGARGYVLKGNPDEISEAVQVTLEGGTFLSAPLKSRY